MAQADTLSNRAESAIGGVAPGPESQTGEAPAAKNKPKAADQAKAREEGQQDTVTQPGGFKNDPDDSTNPNEAIERHRRSVRP